MEIQVINLEGEIGIQQAEEIIYLPKHTDSLQAQLRNKGNRLGAELEGNERTHRGRGNDLMEERCQGCEDISPTKRRKVQGKVRGNPFTPEV